MGRVAVMGPSARVAAYALAGAIVVEADDQAEALAAWTSLDDDVELVILAPEVAPALRGATGPARRLVVEMEP